jgi:two-component system NarL family response regulator
VRSLQHAKVRIVVVGDWPAVDLARGGRRDIRIWGCGDPEKLPEVMDETQADWLVLGPWFDKKFWDQASTCSKKSGMLTRLAILGPASDPELTVSWIRQGVSLYLEESSGLDKLISAMRCSQEHDVQVIDPCFMRQLDRCSYKPDGYDLTHRQLEVLDLVGKGMRNQEISRLLNISKSTVEYHVRHLLAKFDVSNRLELVSAAARAIRQPGDGARIGLFPS